MALTKQLEISEPTSCLNSAADDEPVFVLRANDPLGAEIVDEWVDRSEQRGVHLGRLDDARALAAQMRVWRETH